MAQLAFKAKLTRPPGVGTWTYIPLSKSVTAKLNARGQVRITGALDGLAIESTILPDGEGGHSLVVRKEWRDAIGKDDGQVVAATIEPASKPAKVELPVELKSALAKDAVAKRALGRAEKTIATLRAGTP